MVNAIARIGGVGGAGTGERATGEKAVSRRAQVQHGGSHKGHRARVPGCGALRQSQTLRVRGWAQAGRIEPPGARAAIRVSARLRPMPGTRASSPAFTAHWIGTPLK